MADEKDTPRRKVGVPVMRYEVQIARGKSWFRWSGRPTTVKKMAEELRSILVHVDASAKHIENEEKTAVMPRSKGGRK